MLESTKEKYRKNAHGFYNRHFDGYLPSEGDILLELHYISSDYPPSSFSNIKGYLAFDMDERGENSIAEAIRAFENKAAKLSCYPKLMHKVKNLSDEDLNKIIQAVKSKNSPKTSPKTRIKNNQLIAAVWLARYLGCRPAEMPMVKQTGATTFFIPGVKKDEFGQRGLDRDIEVTDEHIANILVKCIEHIQGAEMSRVRDNFRYLMKKVFPRRKKLPTLYVFRHIMGSNLKASDYSRQEMAYIMGHQSTRTMENYGYRKAGKSGGLMVKPAIGIDEITLLVRDAHTKRNQEMKKRIAKVKEKSSIRRSSNESQHIQHPQ